MNISQDYHFGDFSLKGGKLFYLETVIADETLAPVLSAGSDNIYVVNVQNLFLPYPFVVLVQTREVSLFKATRVETGNRSICFSAFLSANQYRFRQFGPYEYPHEDSAETKLILC